jgi:hypothetical protein
MTRVIVDGYRDRSKPFPNGRHARNRNRQASAYRAHRLPARAFPYFNWSRGGRTTLLDSSWPVFDE